MYVMGKETKPGQKYLTLRNVSALSNSDVFYIHFCQRLLDLDSDISLYFLGFHLPFASSLEYLRRNG